MSLNNYTLKTPKNNLKPKTTKKTLNFFLLLQLFTSIVSE
jgi:hypothetical protein